MLIVKVVQVVVALKCVQDGAGGLKCFQHPHCHAWQGLRPLGLWEQVAKHDRHQAAKQMLSVLHSVSKQSTPYQNLIANNNEQDCMPAIESVDKRQVSHRA